MKTIFVSSTFRDMDLERDAIQQRVRPMLNREAQKFGESISFCDLRWGIDTSFLESETGARKVLDVCLDEIDRCQPPMVVILGYRYGWIPSEELIRSAAGRHALELDDLEKSVTALEIEYGALADPEKLTNTLFYFREISGTPDADYLPEDEDHLRRLQALKGRIRSLTGSRVKTYTLRWEGGGFSGIEDFADLLGRDLLALLKPQWEQYEAMSPRQKELLIHESYMREKAVFFRARKVLADHVLDGIREGETLTVLKGSVGSGKSTLLSHLSCRLRQEGWNTLALFCNLTPQTGTAMEILQLIVAHMENERKYTGYGEGADGGNELSGTEADKFRAFATGQGGQKKESGVKQWQQRLDRLCALYAKSGRRIVFLLDAVDQLFHDDFRDDLVFIPQLLGNNIRFIMTCLPEIGCKGHRCITIPPITQEDREQVVSGILSAHNRELSREVIGAMTALPAADNPLYLSFLVQRLLMMHKADFDAIRSRGDGMDAITAHQLEVLSSCPHTLEDMSAELIDSAARRVGGTMVRQALELLALAPHGLRTSDLEGLLGDSFCLLDFSHFISYMSDCFLIRSDGRYDFSHKSIREGLLERCEGSREGHRRLLAHFRSLEAGDDIRCQELVYHCIRADDKAYFVEYVQDVMWENDRATEYAARSTYAASLTDGGEWLCEVLRRGEEFGAVRYLVQFVYKPYDRLCTSRLSEIDVLKKVHYENCVLARSLANRLQDRRDWAAFGYALEALADITEAMKSEQELSNAKKYRENHLSIAEELHRIFDDEVSVRLLARTHMNLASALEKSVSENRMTTLEHLNKALELRKRLVTMSDKEKDRADLAALHLKLAQKHTGFVSASKKESEPHVRAATEMYRKLYDETGNPDYLTQLAALQAVRRKFKTQIAILKEVLRRENSIPRRLLLAEAYMDYMYSRQYSLKKEKEMERSSAGAIELYRSVVEERGAVSDLRNLSQALCDSAELLSWWEKERRREMVREAVELRETLCGRELLSQDRAFLAKAYSMLSWLEEDEAVCHACGDKALEYGYVDKRCAYSELLEVLRHMDKYYINKIPKDVIMYIYDRCDMNYEFLMTKSLAETELRAETRNMLWVFYESYWKEEGSELGDMMARMILDS